MFSSIFNYCDGVLTWISGRRKGKIAGCVNCSGYVVIGVNGKCHYAHRIIWEMHSGEIPEGMEIDHINHIRNDNRIENLRLVNTGVNAKNRERSKSNKSGHTGVYVTKSGIRARIFVNGKMINIGSFPTIEEAAKARTEAENEYKFHANHGTKKRP